MDLNFEVRKQIISRIDKEKVVNLSENYLRLCFDFKTEDWHNLTKFILIKHDDKTTQMGLVNDKVVIPSSLLTKDKFVFSLYGLDTSDDSVYRITTNLVRFRLLNSGYTNDTDDPLPPEPIDIVEEIYIAIQETKEYCKEYTDDGLSEKVDIASIVDDLTHTDVDKPLSANQGKVLKDLTDTKANTVEVDNALNNKSDKGHKHLKSDITDFTHTHDDRYYTESETNTLLGNKANIEHRHNLSDIGDYYDYKLVLQPQGMVTVYVNGVVHTEGDLTIRLFNMIEIVTLIYDPILEAYLPPSTFTAPGIFIAYCDELDKYSNPLQMKIK